MCCIAGFSGSCVACCIAVTNFAGCFCVHLNVWRLDSIANNFCTRSFEFFERLGELSLNEVYSALGIPANRMTDNLFHHGKRPVLMLAASGSLDESDSVSGLTACPGTWAGVERILRVDYSARVADLVVPHLASFRGGVATFEAIQSSVPADDPGALFFSGTTVVCFSNLFLNQWKVCVCAFLRVQCEMLSCLRANNLAFG